MTDMKIKLNGEYQTIEQYALEHNISKRGARKRVESKYFPHEVVRFERLILIKIS
jgi:hypothetical protein